VDVPLFDQVADAVRGLAPPEFANFRHRARRWGIKIWFGSDVPQREHYEAQVIGADHVDRAAVLALEVGFHAEHPRAADNAAVLTFLLESEHRWRPVLGDEVIAGPFLGHSTWRRVSETWPDPDLSDVNLAVELAIRLTEYIAGLEPVRRGG
jgi:hypothetical protein